MSNEATTSSNEYSPPKSRRGCWISLVVLLILLPFALIFLYAAGVRTGEEFSPDDFTERSFFYNRLPVINWVVSEKTYSDETSSLQSQLVNLKLISPTNSTPKTWHLTREGGNTEPAPTVCDARFLSEYLRIKDGDGNYFWEEWNEDFPECAKVFWPKVQEMALNQVYLKVPDIMQFAMQLTKDEPEQFEEDLIRLLGQSYLDVGSIELANGKVKEAKLILELAVQYSDAKEAQKLLDQCQSE